MVTVAGTATSRGFVSGPVFLYAADRNLTIPEYTLPADRVGAELARFREARAETRRQLEGVVTDVSARVTGAEADIFRNHLVMLEDETIISAIDKLIRDERLNVEAAMHRVADGFRASFERMNDPYLRERARDLDDVERRMLRVLAGRAETALSQINSAVIIVADDLTPSETVTLPRRHILGFATNKGSATSHVALLARAMGIPAVTGLGDITSRVTAGDHILLDGTNGAVTINADRVTREEFARLIWRERALMSALDEAKEQEGRQLGVRLLANVQPGVPFGSLSTFGAEGIGLYRSEYLWLSGDDEPTENEQTVAYTEAARAAAALGPDARVVFRVLDIGGDKMVKGAKAREANPFLGNRSIRFLLSRRDVFRTQLRAILKASAHGPSAVMYPMVSTIEELRQANAELIQAMSQLRMANIPFDERLPTGCMIEIPSAALNAAMFAKEVSFFSIGTNDLVQYTMAADRGNEQVSYLYQPTNPAVLRLVDMTVRAAKDAGIKCSVCGESASDPVLGFLWTALGVDGLSMSASYIPVIRKTLSSVTPQDAAKIAEEVRAMCATAGAEEIYDHVRRFLTTKIPDLGELQTFFSPPGAEKMAMGEVL
jgi:phosphotransferase system enzyme I (PtsI)